MHKTCIAHGRNIKTRYFGLILTLRLKRDWHSIRLDRMQPSFNEHFQLIVFQKLLDWRLEKSYMRKHSCHLDHHQRSRYVTIGLEEKFHWDLQLINNQKEKLFDNHKKEVARRAKFFQPPQPIPKPICYRSGQLDNTQDVFVVKGETSRSQEVKVEPLHDELCSSDRSGQPDITNMSSEENKNVGVEQTHDRSGQLDKHNIAVQDAPEVHHEIKMLNIDYELIRERIEEDMDFKIPGLPHSIVKQLHSASVRELIQKIENHPNRHALQRDLQQSQSFNPFSQESKQKIHEVGNIELCELLDTEPKTHCKVCLSYWDIGIVYCTCGHFLRKGREENKKFVQYTMDLLYIADYYIKKGRPHGHRYGKKPGDKRILHIAHQLKKCKKKYFQGIHDRFVRDDKFRRNMIEMGRTEDLCRQMDDLADEDHTHHVTPQEIDNYKRKWWIRSNKIGSDTVPIRHRSDLTSNKHCLPCDSSKDKEDEAQRNQRWIQSSSSSWWSWQGSWWTPYSYESHHGDVPSTDWSGQPFKQVIGTLLRGMIFPNSFALLQLVRLQLTAVYCNRLEV